MALSDILYRTRQLVGTRVNGQMSRTDVLAYINRFYQNDMPRLGWVQDMIWLYTVGLVDGVGDYGIDDGIFVVGQPAWVYDSGDDEWFQVWVTSDARLFWANYEFDEDESDESDPAAVLVLDRVLYVRPTPDASYTLYLRCRGKPQALSSDGDTAARDHWDECIAYGAAQLILQDQNELQNYPNVQFGLNQEISKIAREWILQNETHRAYPSF